MSERSVQGRERTRKSVRDGTPGAGGSAIDEAGEALIAMLNDKNIYPDDATLKKLFVITARDPATQRIINRLWTRVKTGR